ncbi:MAG TPA: extracellular solute-binding protein [Alphaproteobacteria bacterium]|jgi:ABC-type Fe3+ transport system substrate-binding protein
MSLRITATTLLAFFSGALLSIGGGAMAVAQDWQAGAPASWAATVAAAKKEGTLVVAGRPEYAKALSDGFKRDTGLSVEFLQGEGREQLSRLAREIRAKQVTIDLLMGGQSLMTFVKDGQLKPVGPQLVLPGVTNPAMWTDGKIKWVDNDGQYLLQTSHEIFGKPVFNGDVIKPGEITNWQDLLKPQYKGKIAAWDPTQGAGQAATGYLIDVFGIDFVKKLFIDQQVNVTRVDRQLMEWVSRGAYPIGLGAVAVEVDRFRQSGVKNLVVAEMTDGPGAIIGGSSVIGQPAGAPHPNAATVFLNWYASQPAQQIYSQVKQVPSRRLDVTTEGIPDYVIPKPGVTYIDQYTEDWYLGKFLASYRDELIKALGGR